jgi:hypothetical protein
LQSCRSRKTDIRDFAPFAMLITDETPPAYQVTDVIDEPGLPFRRLLFAGESQKSWFIHYEHGGIGHGYAVLVFSKAQESGLQFFWGGTGSENAKDLNDLRNKIAAGDFRDNLVFYW